MSRAKRRRHTAPRRVTPTPGGTARIADAHRTAETADARPGPATGSSPAGDETASPATPPGTPGLAPAATTAAPPAAHPAPTPATPSATEAAAAGPVRAEPSAVADVGHATKAQAAAAAADGRAKPTATGTVLRPHGRRSSPKPRPRTVRARISAVGRGSVARTGVLVVGGLGAATAVASTVAWGVATLIAPDALPRPGIWLTVSTTVIVLEVVLGSCLTALVGFLYNLTAPYDGGVEISLTDDQGQSD
ncbi:DUF3566 domain-containing protein [Streptomyces sp. NPDC013172]|uniref:DUF3566 domain-containing protein n=1 Tax=Streptomyces sp. NPDC013172 TaxID=3155009 RepID=UPI0033D5E097